MTVACLSSLWAQENKTAKPNVVFFFIDDMGYRDLGCYGAEIVQTPQIDALAETGIRFTKAYVAAAVCAPSRAAVLSGRHCLELGLWRASHDIPPQTTIFPKILSDAGYQSWHLGKWHMGGKKTENAPVSLGFDIGLAGENSLNPGSHFWPYYKGSPENKNQSVPDLREIGGEEGEYLTDRLTDEAIKLIDQRDPNKPFYLSLWHYAVHAPVQAKPEKIKKYEKLLRNQQKRAPRIDPVTGAKYPQVTESATYLAMIESVDESVGKVVARLKSEGLYQNTLIIFYSDNGPTPISTVKPFRGAKNSLYEGGLRVPAIFSWPGRIQPGVSDARIWTLDVFRTVLDAADVDVPVGFEGSEGMSLMPHMAAGEDVPNRMFYWYFPENRDNWGARASTVILDENDLKYHLFFSDEEPELYDLKNDQAESENLARQYPEKTQQLEERLIAKMQPLYRTMPKPERFRHLIPKIEERLKIKD